MYALELNGYRIECNTADEVRSLCNGSANGSSVTTPRKFTSVGMTADNTLANLDEKPARRKYRRKATDTRGKSMSERWAKAHRYAKRHGVTPREAFAIVSK